jgi:hypothetical protein
VYLRCAAAEGLKRWTVKGDRYGKKHGKARNGPGGPKCPCCASGKSARNHAQRTDSKEEIRFEWEGDPKKFGKAQ